MQVQLPAGVEVDVDDTAVVLRVNGRPALQVVEDEAAELGTALVAAAEVLRLRRRALEPPRVVELSTAAA
jgi:hypothetical protein